MNKYRSEFLEQQEPSTMFIVLKSYVNIIKWYNISTLLTVLVLQVNRQNIHRLFLDKPVHQW